MASGDMDLRSWAPNILSLCSGIGGIELGLSLVMPSARVVAYLEGEAYAAACLVARMEEGILDPAPIWSDVRTFDGRPWRGKVDLVTAGFPCQPVSAAGKKLVQKDKRWLWPKIARIVREVEPSFVFLENVPGLLVHGFEDVLGDLAELGFHAGWTCVRASDLGAPHIRRRVFVLARRERNAIRLKPERGGDTARQAEQGDAELAHARAELAYARTPQCEGAVAATKRIGPRDSGRDLADPESGRRRELRESSGSARLAECGSATPLADGDSGRQQSIGLAQHDGLERESGDEPDGRSDDWLEQWPPGPDYRGEWPLGLEPSVRRVAHGIPNRLDRLRALGNGVVPSVAAAAFEALMERMSRERER